MKIEKVANVLVSNIYFDHAGRFDWVYGEVNGEMFLGELVGKRHHPKTNKIEYFYRLDDRISDMAAWDDSRVWTEETLANNVEIYFIF